MTSAASPPFALLLLALLLLSPGARADGPGAGRPAFDFPVRCEIGVDCWYSAYVDMEAGPNYRDHRCGVRSYEGHEGTDIAPVDPAASPVVLAAADGVVIGRRDGMDDRPMTGPDEDRKAGRCGNGARIDHGGGWVTQYCHLARGSVTVGEGARIAAGQVLGRIGSSGWSELPHLHFQLEHDGTIVDPFAGRSDAAPAACSADGLAGAPPQPLWRNPKRAGAGLYRASVLFRTGLTTQVPEAGRAWGEGYPPVAGVGDAALIAYVVVLGAHAGTRIDATILDPAGTTLFQGAKAAGRDYARYLTYAGKRRTDAAWAPGVYRARLTLSGEGPAGPFRETAEAVVELR